MYSSRPNIVLGFHGCDESIRDSVISGKTKLKPSNNNWDWLGAGIYFWEYNPTRADDFAAESKEKWGKIEKPASLGAVIYLGHCLDLLDKKNLDLVKKARNTFVKALKVSGLTNRNVGKGVNRIIRELDCWVINTIHENNKTSGLKPFDSVRAVFIEGKPLYPTAGFFDKTHIQICVTNPNSIKGYFLPLSEDPIFSKV